MTDRTKTGQARPAANIGTDQRGAIMVMGVLMAVFLVAALYYTIGIGDALLHRQRMQDAADAAAFSSAVIHARGMNVIVLINMIMAALLTVLVAVKMVETVLIAAIAVLAALSFLTAGMTASAIPHLEQARSSTNRVFTRLKPEIYRMLKVLHKTGRAVRASVPFAAEVRVVDTVVGHYNPPAYFGVAIPDRWTLPVQNDRFNVLCEKAGKNVGWLVAVPVRAILPDAIGDSAGELIETATSGLAGSLTNWFCGDGSAQLPTPEVTFDKQFPTLPSRKACEKYAEGVGNSDRYSAQEHEKLCLKAEQDEKASDPDGRGYCRFLQEQDEQQLQQEMDEEQLRRQCDPYWTAARMARSACDPQNHGLKDYIWQQRTVEVYYVKTPAGWDKLKRVVAADRKERQGNRPPCSKDKWNRNFVRAIDPNVSVPVCLVEEDDDCPLPPEPQYDENGNAGNEPREGDEFVSCAYEEVAQVFGCKKQFTKEYKPDVKQGDRIDGRDNRARAANRSPFKLEDKIELGDEDFQMRAVIVGRRGSTITANAEGVMRVATWGRQGVVNAYQQARNLGRFSVAQAEYYYGGGEEREQWMWHMNWRARLKRFRLPQAEDDNARDGSRGAAPELIDNGIEPPRNQEQACRNARDNAGGSGRGDSNGDTCSDMTNAIDKIEELVVH